MSEKNNKNNSVNSLLSIIIVILLIFTLAFSVLFIKSNVTFGAEKSVVNADIGELDASSEKDVSDDLIIKDFNGDGFILSLDENKNYIFLSNDMACQFYGNYEYKKGQEALDYVSAKELRKAGLNPKYINVNNLYIIKANCNEHIFNDGTEYYNENIHDSQKSAFFFLVYFKNSSDGQTLSGIHYLGDISKINFNSSYF